MGPGEWLQAHSLKHQAGGPTRPEHEPVREGPSSKDQAPSIKRQASKVF